MRNRVAVAALVLLLSGCALIKQGTSQKVLIDTRPSGAVFELNGVKYTTPSTVELPKKEHEITFKAKGFKDGTLVLKTRTSSYFYWGLILGVISATVDWISGAWQEFDIDNEEGRARITILERTEDNPEQQVAFSSSPPGAYIWIDGVQQKEITGPRFTGSAKLVLIWGEKEKSKKVKLSLDEHESFEAVLKREDKEFHANLVPKPLRPTVTFESDPPGAEVFIDGVRVSTETTPLAVIVEWKRGHMEPRKVEFRKPGYKSDLSQTLRSDKVVNVKGRLDLIVKSVPLRIDCWPAGSTVEVDGRTVAISPAVVQLPWSVEQKSHKIRLTRPGYLPEDILVEEAQNETPVTRRLKPFLPRFP